MENTVNERFKTVRKKLKLTQKKFGEELGISQTHVSGIEKGNENPSLTLLKLISVKFLIDENWLLCGEEAPKPELDPLSDDGLINRYKTIIKLFDTLIPRMDEYSLEYFEQSIEFLASILFNTDLNNINNTLYLKNIYSILNELEQIIYLVSKDTLKKVNVKNIVSYKKIIDNRISVILENINEAVNINLENNL